MLSEAFGRLGSPDFSAQLAYGQSRALDKPLLKCTTFHLLLASPAKERAIHVFFFPLLKDR